MSAPAYAALGRVGGLTTVARHGPDAVAARARAGLWRKFENAVDPDRVLAPDERRRMAALEQRRYYAQLALRSARARRAATPPGKAART